jgi:glutathione S-transferase
MRLLFPLLAAHRAAALSFSLPSLALAPLRLFSTGNPFLPALEMSAPHPPALGPSQAGNVPGQGPAKIHLWTAGTPNGYKASVTLEELRAAYPEEAKDKLSYDVSAISIWKNEQKHPDFLKINPNGRIPAIIDDNFNGHNVFESASIQLWLVENYDPENKLWFSDPIERSFAISWIFWAQGGLGPMQGQANHFFRYAPIKIPYGIKRYTEETARLYSVIEDGLKAGKNGWLVGGKFSIADINVYGWARAHGWAGVDTRPFPLTHKWLATIEARPAVQKGLQVPSAPRILTQQEEDEAYAEVKEWVKKADAEIEAAKQK